MSVSHRRTWGSRARRDREAGQGLVEFALVFPLFMLLMLFIIEFAFVFSALLGVNYASRNAALTAAEAGNDRLADCLILQQVEGSIGAPGNKANVTTVTIYRSDQSGSARLATLVYTRTTNPALFTTCTKASTTLSVPYALTSGTYTYDQRCNILVGCPNLVVAPATSRPIDTIGVDISYRHTWVTPIGNFGLAGTGVTLTQSNAMRMEPIL